MMKRRGGPDAVSEQRGDLKKHGCGKQNPEKGGSGLADEKGGDGPSGGEKKT